MTPILYSFRRCPYAIRARLAVACAGVRVELREILLRDKAAAFLATSPSGTVPCLALDGRVIDESYDIMLWAVQQHDPLGWLDMPEIGFELIEESDGSFKKALDRTKYHTRYPDEDPEHNRATAMAFLSKLDTMIDANAFIFGQSASLADMAILPFVRQFAFINKPRFDAEASPNLRRWLEAFLISGAFTSMMLKLPVWQDGDAPTYLHNTLQVPDV